MGVALVYETAENKVKVILGDTETCVLIEPPKPAGDLAITADSDIHRVVKLADD